MVVESAPEVLRDPDYYHWDQLRHRPLPEGISLENYWKGIKFRRETSNRLIPAFQAKNNDYSFFYNATDKIQRQLHEMDFGLGGEIASAKKDLPSEVDHQRYLIRSLMEEAISSSQLEGAVTTSAVAREMLKTGRKPANRPETMILNNYTAMSKLRAWKNKPLDKDLLFEIHRLVTFDTLDDPDAAGRFRTDEGKEKEIAVWNEERREVFHQPPPASELEERCNAMCAFANGEHDDDSFIHPMIRAIVLHFWLAYDHPFVDGNGRTARALFYWAMLHAGYWLVEYMPISRIIKRARTPYYMAFLYTETDAGDLTYFILYHLDVLEKAKQEIHEYLERKQKEINIDENGLKEMLGLNMRQRALLAHALRHPNQIYTFKSHKNSHGIAYGTARNDILELEEKGFLISKKSGKTQQFMGADGLLEKLRREPD